LTIKKGDIIKHSLFGVGRVEGITGIADKKQAEINFQSVGKKSVMIKFAKMERINKF